MTSHTRTSSLPVCYPPPISRCLEFPPSEAPPSHTYTQESIRIGRLTIHADKKAREELAKTVGKGKGPLNTGSQGIKKSGKK